MSEQSRHIPVLLQEVRDGLAVKPDDTVVDGTVGSAGHGKMLAEMLSKKGVFIGIDRDEDALLRSREKLKGVDCIVHLKEGNYRNVREIVQSLSFSHIDRFLIDLGLSSNQLSENNGRGFSFLRDEPLIMTFSKDSEGITAKEVVNTYDRENLADVLFGYGEEKFAKRISEEIEKKRRIKTIETTFDLVKIIEEVVPGWYKRQRIHFATKTFQALRALVNDEIESLKTGLYDGIELLTNEGRIAVITFHSIEDRIVKNIFREKVAEGVGVLINKKPIIPTKEEIQINSRARSAKLRIFEKK